MLFQQSKFYSVQLYGKEIIHGENIIIFGGGGFLGPSKCTIMAVVRRDLKFNKK
jgi:hypothetical protein